MKSQRSALTGLSLILVLLVLFGDCGTLTQAKQRRRAAKRSAKRSARRGSTTTVDVTLSHGEKQDLLIGYTLLADTLKDESKLWALRWLKKLTIRPTAREIDSIMDKLSSSAHGRKHELQQLRKLAPDVTGTPEKMSTIGDAITAAAKEVGTGEMLDNSLAFNLRFMVLQAQATRMVAAMADAIAKEDRNQERKKWLGEVSVEYEGYRDDILDVIRKYVRGQGSEQLNPSWIFSRSYNATQIPQRGRA